MSPENDNSWKEWSKFVLKELERLNEQQGELYDKVEKIHYDVGQLKIRSGIWGLMGGMIPVAVGLMVYFLK